MRHLILTLALALSLAVTLAPAPPALAVEPDEILDDPVLEARARALSRDLRCLVCRNESIDESNAPLARDLRLLVRERLVAGDTDAQVIAFIVARYGEYVLLRPLPTGSNWLLLASGPAALILGLGLSFAYLRRRRPEAAADDPAATPLSDLSDEEKKRLAEILRG